MTRHTINTPYMVGKVHLYTFDTEDGLIMFDTGPSSIETRDYLQNRIDPTRLKKVFVTHCHIDHSGMLDFIEQNTDAEIYLSRHDSMLYENHDRRMKVVKGILADLEFPENICEIMLEIFNSTQILSNKYKILEESTEELGKIGIEYISCKWHSQSDIIYLYKGYAVLGDLVLNNIFTTPILDMDFDKLEGRFKNYIFYCETLKKLKEIEHYTLLPGHREAVASIDEWIIYSVSKFLGRALKLKTLINSTSVYNVVQTIVSDINSMPVKGFIKTSEVLFMKDMLMNPDILKNSLEDIGLFSIFKKQFEAISS